MNTKHLKAKILDLAIHGKLVPQDSNDEPASVLLEKIHAEKAEKIKKGELKKDKKDSFIFVGDDNCHYEKFADGSIINIEEDIPFDIPENWCWCRVGDIFQHNTGKAMNSSAKEINKTGSIRKFITTSNLYWNEFDFTNVKEMFFSDDELPRCTVTKGDILINEGGAYFGRTAIWNYDYDICFQNHVHRLRPFIKIEREYFYYIFYLYRNTNRMQSKGTAMPGLSSEVLHSTIIPLPPLAEQKRIVDAVEQAFEQIEIIEKNKLNLNTYARQTKAKILDLAIRGKLVPQIAAEGNARDLLEEIRKEKLSHGLYFANAKFGKRKSKKETALAGSNPCDIKEDEIPFEIPENWCWCRLGEICKLINGDKVQNLKLPLLDVKYLRGEKKADIISSGELATINDLLILVDGENSGEVFINKEEGIIGSTFKKLIISKELFLPYVLCFIRMKRRLLKNSKKGSAIPHLNKKIFFELLLPLPPLAEQKRIVDAVEKMLPLCEKLGK